MSAALCAPLLLAPAALAETQPDTLAPAACPGQPLSVYFSSGETAVSSQAHELVVRIGAAARTCETADIALITHVDAAEGPAALTLALQRLMAVSRELEEQGLAPDRIRAVAMPSSRAMAGLRQVEIIFGAGADAVSSGPAQARHTLHADPV